MLEEILVEVVNQAIQQAAMDAGKELGRELKNFLRVTRGEAEWDELTHVQQTMFLGGDRSEYERIRQRIRGAISSSSAARRTTNAGQRDREGSIPRGPFFDYGNF